MGFPEGYLRYPVRVYEMDHDRYDFSTQPDRKPIGWPGRRGRVPLWVVVALEFFPLNQPAQSFKAPGDMVTPYPELRHYTLRTVTRSACGRPAAPISWPPSKASKGSFPQCRAVIRRQCREGGPSGWAASSQAALPFPGSGGTGLSSRYPSRCPFRRA